MPCPKRKSWSQDDFVQDAEIRAKTGKTRQVIYEGHLESKERFAIQRYLLIIGKKTYMQVL